ncbi:MAG TPA: 2-C-methyl-D-erythritol 2,4-cyclodiphosphate synthase [Gammaproteobacteria bacterium]|nr:2-C-methyl-D-erythritol 2,4-cyclodiphosphate synthase [Gammaproteobacteria bacterium]
MRVGQGFDVHRFADGDHVMLGGVRLAHERGIVAHSDGDVLLHALTDALLGASGLGDIGALFPDTDPAYAGADSRALVSGVMSRLHETGWRVVNADCTVLAERPKIAPHVAVMRAAIAQLLDVDVSAVSVKATTAERLGFVGREEGIAALAAVLIERPESRS